MCGGNGRRNSASILEGYSSGLFRGRRVDFIDALKLGFGAGVPEEESHSAKDEEDEEGQKEAEEVPHGGRLAGWGGGVNIGASGGSYRLLGWRARNPEPRAQSPEPGQEGREDRIDRIEKIRREEEGGVEQSLGFNHGYSGQAGMVLRYGLFRPSICRDPQWSNRVDL